MKTMYVKASSEVFQYGYVAQIPAGWFLNPGKVQQEISEEDFNSTRKTFIANIIMSGRAYPLYEVAK